MKVLFVNRENWNSARGGDSVQMENTASELIKLGIEVDIYESIKNYNYSNYDLLHLFNVIRPEHLLAFTQLGIPFVVSTIYVDYAEVDSNLRGTSFKLLQKTVGNNRLQYLKSVARALSGNSTLPHKRYLLNGHRNAVLEIARKASILLPNSKNEATRFSKNYTSYTPYKVIPNGINASAYSLDSRSKREGLLCVARFEHLKNQLTLMEAVVKTDLSLTLVGDPSPNQYDYYQDCVQFAEKHPHQLKILSHFPSEKLPELYALHRVHVLPSWFETTGLVNLEAAASGCNIVISTKGDTHEYFGNKAIYCEPNSVDSIQRAIEKAYALKPSEELRHHILENYTWQIAAQKTLEAYTEVLHEKA